MSTTSLSAPPQEAAKALSDALSALGAPPAPPAALEWMYAFPAARTLLHSIATKPLCQLTDTELNALRTLPPPDTHVINLASPALRTSTTTSPTYITTLQDKIALLRTQRDILSPLTRSQTPPPDAFADIDPGCDSDSAVVGRVLAAATRARISRQSLPIPTLPIPITSHITTAIAAERTLLASALRIAATARTAASSAADTDAKTANTLLSKFEPRLKAANPTASTQAHRAVTRALAIRAHTRRTRALDATATALATVADLRVRLDALLRALAARRALLASASKAAKIAASAAPPAHTPLASRPRDDPLLAIYKQAHHQLHSLWQDTDHTLVDNDPRLRATAAAVGERAAAARARANVAPPHCAADALDTVERAVARNAAALDRLLRERRGVAPPAAARRGEKESRYRAVFELHTAKFAAGGKEGAGRA